MNCPILKADAEGVARAVEIIAAGGVIAVPTETVYGVMADATNAAAVDRLRESKRRSDDQPFQVLVKDLEQAKQVAIFDHKATNLAAAIWPGAMTLIVPEREDSAIDSGVAAGGSTIGLRSPNSAVIQEILHEIAFPLASSSANIAGEETPSTAVGVRDMLGDKLDLILNGDVLENSVPSTIVDMAGEHIKILREGEVTKSQILEAISTQ